MEEKMKSSVWQGGIRVVINPQRNTPIVSKHTLHGATCVPREKRGSNHYAPCTREKISYRRATLPTGELLGGAQIENRRRG